MKHFRVQTRAGRMEFCLPGEELLAPAVALSEQHARTGLRFAGRVEFQGRDAWLKADCLRGRARARHAALRLCLETPPPRVREALNLAWLEARLFQVPSVLASGWSGGALPRWQFLLLEHVEAATLESVLRQAPPAERAALLLELARETARMHALHFVHRDLFWRNLLALPAGAPRRLLFLDAWRGGERLQWRGPDYDLACLFLEGPSLLGDGELRDWLAHYREERAALGHPLQEPKLWRAANAARRALLERARREPGRWRVPEAPVQDFDFVKAAR